VSLVAKPFKGCPVFSIVYSRGLIWAGDFNLAFLDLIKEVEGLKWSGNCNELNAAYSADGMGLWVFLFSG
jgi:hypothetical protein